MGEQELDIVEYTSRLALELISQAGLGHTIGSIEGKDDGYSLAIKSFVWVALLCQPFALWPS